MAAENSIDPIVEKGNPMFNVNDAEPLIMDMESNFGQKVEEKLDFTKIDEQRFNPKTNSTPAQSAITQEDLAFEAALQRSHVESALPPAQDAHALTQEKPMSTFLGDMMNNYVPARTLNELEQQVFSAKTHGANSIEASEEIIRFYTRQSYPDKVGYFIYKDIKVFIPGFLSTYKDSDKQNLSLSMRGHV